MKTILFFIIIFISTITLARQNDHYHDFPPSFRVTCNTWNNNSNPSRTDFIWDLPSKKMIITDGAIIGDRDYLKVHKDNRIESTIETMTVLHKSHKVFDGKIVPASKDIHMTFRTKFLESAAYHGLGWTKIRTFMFKIQDGQIGQVVATEITSAEGTLDVLHHGTLGDCSFTGIYANQ